MCSNTGHTGYSVWYDADRNATPSNQTPTFDAANQILTIGKGV